ncbi:MAG: hypothetical protein KME21_24480 [Desmonostoc vinosum HA7617-LM4]|jgi:hypothetical protein|nr:hypothetical protein [Desmonostoc vinosum HA7617-LM4]
MTYQTYSQQALSRYTLPHLKRIASELGVTPTGDKRVAETWVNAIINHQSAQLEKVTDATELKTEAENTTDTKVNAKIEVKELTTVEISSFDYEIYANSKLIASITHDDTHLTQRWVVMVNDKEVFRATTPMRCHRYICTHYKDGTLPVQEQQATPCTSENRIMAHIFNECQKYGFEILDDGIYQNGVKLGQVGYTNGNWWVIRGNSAHQQYSDSVFDAVRLLSMVSELTDCEQLLDLPFDQLTTLDWQQLQNYEPVPELVAA